MAADDVILSQPHLLDVWLDDHLGRRKVGTLERVAEPGHPYQARILFHYAVGLKDEDALSLLMPIRRESYSSSKAGLVDNLLPIFDQNLPEGVLRDYLLRRYQKVIPDMGDFDLLRLVGSHGIGRVRVISHGASGIQDLSEDEALYPLRSLMADVNSEALLHSLFERLSKYSGVSGVQPKVLLSDRLDVVKPSDGQRLTVPDEHYIIKIAAEDFPWLTINEHICLYAARMSGLDTVETHLSDDGRVLAVTRFDRDPQTGVPIGFEDAACLAGLTAHDKYKGNYESLVEHLVQMLAREDRTGARLTLFKLMVLNVLIGNGDAHHKNFGVLYADPESATRLAPVFDVCCTTAYLPQDHLALSLDGGKAFPARVKLAHFGRKTCRLLSSQIEAVFGEVATGIEAACAELNHYCQVFPDFADTCGEPMRRVWRSNLIAYFNLEADYQLPVDASRIGEIAAGI